MCTLLLVKDICYLRIRLFSFVNCILLHVGEREGDEAVAKSYFWLLHILSLGLDVESNISNPNQACPSNDIQLSI